MNQPHGWKRSPFVYPNDPEPRPHDFCTRCGLMRARVAIETLYQWRSAPRFATLYRLRASDPWTRRLRSQNVPPCYGGIPPASATL